MHIHLLVLRRKNSIKESMNLEWSEKLLLKLYVLGITYGELTLINLDLHFT